MHDYYAEIKAWDWNSIKRHALLNLQWDKDNSELVGTLYLGSVLHLYPSGKIYAPWTTNQTDEDVTRDTAYAEALEQVAAEHGMFITSGEGSGDDIFAAINLHPSDFDNGKHGFLTSDDAESFKDYITNQSDKE